MRPLEADFENVKLSDVSVSKIALPDRDREGDVALPDRANRLWKQTGSLLSMLTNHGTQ
jgi:hypothetical protein